MHRQSDNTVPSATWFLIGATAVGKTAVAQYLAEETGASILSADAMLVYRGMDIGTAKPTPAERGEVRYFGIDLADPDEPFSAGAWLAQVRAQLADAAGAVQFAQAGTPGGGLLVAGGTGLYVRALIQSLDASAADPVRRQYWQERLAREGVGALVRELTVRAPQAAAKLADPDNPRRVIRALEHLETSGALPASWRGALRPRLVGLRLPRAALHARIAARVARMFAAGFIEEVKVLRARYPSWGEDSRVSRGVRMPARQLDDSEDSSNSERLTSHTSRGVGLPAETAEQAGLPGSGCAGPGDKDAEVVLGKMVATARQAIGYAEVCDLLDNRLTREQAIAQIVVRTRQLAKRQETWFRHQAEATWIDISADEPVGNVAARVLAAWRDHGPTPIRLS